MNNPYKNHGFKNREEYLENLCDDYDEDAVYAISELLGPTEDFDGLVSMLEDTARLAW